MTTGIAQSQISSLSLPKLLLLVPQSRIPLSASTGAKSRLVLLQATLPVSAVDVQ